MRAARPQRLLLTIHAEMAVHPIEPPVRRPRVLMAMPCKIVPSSASLVSSIFMWEPTSRIAHPAEG